MITLSIRYTIDPNKLDDFKSYVQAELQTIRNSGGKAVAYFLPTNFSGPTNEALGLIDLPSVASYEDYRNKLENDPLHKAHITRLQESGVIIAMNRSFIQRVEA